MVTNKHFFVAFLLLFTVQCSVALPYISHEILRAYWQNRYGIHHSSEASSVSFDCKSEGDMAVIETTIDGGAELCGGAEQKNSASVQNLKEIILAVYAHYNPSNKSVVIIDANTKCNAPHFYATSSGWMLCQTVISKQEFIRAHAQILEEKFQSNS